MLSGPDGRTVVSSLGWVDGGGLWVFDAAAGRAITHPLGDAKHLSLHAGDAGHFAAVHHHDGDRLEITAHAFAEPERVLARAVVTREARRVEGPAEVWAVLPRHYVGFLKQPAWSDHALVTVDAGRTVSLQTFAWFGVGYDLGYQGIIGVTPIPGSTHLLVSIQRCSRPVIHDPVAGAKVGEVALAGRHGNPVLRFRRAKDELWASDYDTLVTLEPGTWLVRRRRNLQRPLAGTGLFIGDYAFDEGETLCAVARPFSGDVVAVETERLRTRWRAQLGRQPLEAALLPGGRVVARDWKSGDLLRGELRRARFG